MSNLLKYAMVFVMILVGIIALSLCAECSLDACGKVLCGGVEGSRPPGRLASKLTGAFLSAAMGLGLFAMSSTRLNSALVSFVREPSPLRASSLRI
jgi:hypothetical protein